MMPHHDPESATRSESCGNGDPIVKLMVFYLAVEKPILHSILPQFQSTSSTWGGLQFQAIPNANGALCENPVVPH